MAATAPEPAGAGLLPQAEFAWKVHGYTSEHIRFGDAKAGAVTTWCAALIAALFAAKAHQNFMDARFAADFNFGVTLLAVGSLFAFALLAAAVSCAFWAVEPRLWSSDDSKDHPKGFIYWKMIRATEKGRNGDTLRRWLTPFTCGESILGAGRSDTSPKRQRGTPRWRFGLVSTCPAPSIQSTAGR